MKRNNFIVVAGIFFIAASSGCISVPNSQSPRFYTLSPNLDQAGKEFALFPQAIIGIGPVEIPEYLNRPHMVTYNKDKTLKFAQFDRWGEPLDRAIARLLNEDLAVMLEGASLQTFPWNFSIPVKYQVVINVVQLESELDKDLFFVAQWSIIDLEKKEMVLTKRSQFRQSINPHTYAGLAQTLSAACNSLSGDIAAALAAQTANVSSKNNKK